MSTTQQQPRIFDEQETDRAVGLFAGSETGNPSEAEAMGKFRAFRRMVAAKTLRIVDALELPEIRAALDAQLQPLRQPVPEVTLLQAENEDLRGKLAEIVPEVTRLADALTREKESTAQLSARLQGRLQRNRSVTATWLSALALALVVEGLVGIIGLIQYHETAHSPERASFTLPAAKPSSIRPEIKPDTEVEQLMGKQEPRPRAKPKPKLKPVPESQF